MLGMVWAIDEVALQQAISLLHIASADVVQALAPQILKAFHAGPANDAARAALPISTQGNVAIVQLSGVMVPYKTRQVSAALRAAAADSSVDTILLSIDSPGGTVSGTEQLAHDVAQVKGVKPVIASVDGIGASAAYWVASQANKIFTTGRNSLIGSLGTRMIVNDFSQFFAKHGIKAVPVDTGEFKSAGAFGTELTETQRADFQRVTDALNANFKMAVGSGRNLPEAAVNSLFTGQVWPAKDVTGKADATGLGLIDGIQPLDETLAAYYRQPARGRSTASAHARIALATKTHA